MEKRYTMSIRTEIFSTNLMVAAVTILLTLVGTLYITVWQSYRALDQNLMNSARVIARVPLVVEACRAGEANQISRDFLDTSIEQIGDIDTIVLVDLENMQIYHPQHGYIGQPYSGQAQQRIFNGGVAFTSEDTGLSGAERCAYAPVETEDGTLVGCVMVGIYMRNVAQNMSMNMNSFIFIAIIVAVVAIAFSVKLSERIRRSFMGYEPEAFLGLFHQREDILEALEEGVMAIDDSANVMYINKAAATLLGKNQKDLVGKAIREVYPKSTLDRMLYSRRPEHNVPLTFLGNEQILSDRMPILEDDRVIGAVEIWRNRTEVTRLAKDLTGVRHMVEAMRAYTHEFMNKLHVVLGLLQMGQPQEAEEYIMDVTSIQKKAVGTIMDSIEDPSVAALLVGKTSRCAELGIRLIMDESNCFSADNPILPADGCVTILGNLIENALDALNQRVSGSKEIIVSVKEENDDLLICVEDTGPGMEVEVVRNMFRWGFSTKSIERGTGLSLVHEVITAYNGRVRVESEPGVGSVFFISFQRNSGREQV